VGESVPWKEGKGMGGKSNFLMFSVFTLELQPYKCRESTKQNIIDMLFNINSTVHKTEAVGPPHWRNRDTRAISFHSKLLHLTDFISLVSKYLDARSIDNILICNIRYKLPGINIYRRFFSRRPTKCPEGVFTQLKACRSQSGSCKKKG